MLVSSSIYQAYRAVEGKLVLGTIPLGFFQLVLERWQCKEMWLLNLLI